MSTHGLIDDTTAVEIEFHPSGVDDETDVLPAVSVYVSPRAFSRMRGTVFIVGIRSKEGSICENAYRYAAFRSDMDSVPYIGNRTRIGVYLNQKISGLLRDFHPRNDRERL